MAEDAQIADNEPDGNYYYRIDGTILAQAYWSLTYDAFIVPDGNTQTITLHPTWYNPTSSPTFSGSYGALDVSESGNLTVDVTDSGGVNLTVNGENFQFDQSTIAGIEFNGDGTDDLDILRTDVPVLVPYGGARVYVNIGDSGSVQGIESTVTIGHNSGDTINVDDSNDHSYRNNVTVTATGIIGLAPGDIDYYQGSLTALTINGGMGGDTFVVASTPWSEYSAATTIDTDGGTDTINVRRTMSPLEIDGGGFTATETINVGSQAPSLGGTLANIQGAITVYNSSAALNVDDSNDHNAQTATIGSTTLSGLAPADVYYSDNAVSSLTVRGGEGDNHFRVTGTPGPTLLHTGGNKHDIVNVLATANPLTINGNGGENAINVGSMAPNLGGTPANIQAAITVTNTSDLSALILDDSGDSADQAGTISGTSITGFGMGQGGTINYVGKQLAALMVRCGTGANNITVTGTSTPTTLYPGGTSAEATATVNVGADSSPLTIDGNNLTDAINVGSLAPSMGSTLVKINAAVTLNEMSGSSTLSVDDSGDSQGRRGTINGTSITGFGMGSNAAINYTGSQLAYLTVRRPGRQPHHRHRHIHVHDALPQRQCGVDIDGECARHLQPAQHQRRRLQPHGCHQRG